MDIKTDVKAGGWQNHNETLGDEAASAPALPVRSDVKAGGWTNHNEPLLTTDMEAARARDDSEK